MINIEETIQAAAQKIRKVPQILDLVGRRTLGGAAAEIVRIMRRPVARRRGEKVDWDSPVQQKAYYASGGFGHGIPYEPTGGAEAAWQHQAISNGHMVSNVGHKAVFLYGTASGIGKGTQVTSTGQSHIHAGRRRVFRVVVDAVVSRLPESIVQALKLEIGK
jgi:hypothetical protein